MEPQKNNKSIASTSDYKSSNFDFLLELTDDELDLLAGGETISENNLSDFHQSF